MARAGLSRVLIACLAAGCASAPSCRAAPAVTKFETRHHSPAWTIARALDQAADVLLGRAPVRKGAYPADGNARLALLQDLFAVVLSGAVKIVINQTYPLKDAAQAQRDLEERRTVGSTVLIV